jgi:hypothetical protein
MVVFTPLEIPIIYEGDKKENVHSLLMAGLKPGKSDELTDPVSIEWCVFRRGKTRLYAIRIT